MLIQLYFIPNYGNEDAIRKVFKDNNITIIGKSYPSEFLGIDPPKIINVVSTYKILNTIVQNNRRKFTDTIVEIRTVSHLPKIPKRYDKIITADNTKALEQYKNTYANKSYEWILVKLLKDLKELKNAKVKNVEVIKSVKNLIILLLIEKMQYEKHGNSKV